MPAAVLKAESQRIAVMAKVKPAVVAIFAAAGRGAARAWSFRPTVMP